MRLLAAIAAALGVAGCGGGGGGGDDAGSGGNPAATPTSGTYAWLLKAEGSTSDLKYALSLVHPQQKDVEVAIEPASASVTDARLVSQGDVDGVARTASNLSPYALVYIVGGDVRRVPLRADGRPPAQRVQRAQTSSACAFVVDAIDHASPERSRFVISTAGADGRCNTVDDGSAELRLDASAGVVLTPLTGAAPIAALRDPTTTAPRGWMTPTATTLWDGSGATLRPAADPIQRAVLATSRSVLVESASGLSLVEFGAGTSFTETALPAVSGSGWQPLGYDAQSTYVYRNAGGVAPTWQVLRIQRTSFAVTALASGNGQIVLASMGRDVLYSTVIDGDQIELRRLRKAVPGVSTLLERGPIAANFYTVIAGASNTHLRWRVTGLDGTAPDYRLDVVDEDGLSLYSASGGGFSLGLADAGRIDFEHSESRSRFLFVEDYGARFFGDATLVSYDGAARAATRIGRLPGSAEFGTDYVFANVIGGPVGYHAGFASRSINGVVQAAGTRVFSYDAAVAGSIAFTSRLQ